MPRICFILDTDASDTAIGAELLQLQEGEEKSNFHMVVFYTQSCPKKITAPPEKELLAVLSVSAGEFLPLPVGKDSFLVHTGP